MEAYPDTAVDLLRALIRFPSLTRQEGPIADYVMRFLAAHGLAVGRHADNVYATLGDGPDRLLLNSHLDVVPPAENHPYDPFEPVLEGGLLYGRGAVDAKASGAAMAMAVVGLAREGWRPPGGQVVLALTAAEEGGSDYNGLADLRPHLPPLSAALVGEPTAMQPCTAQKGLLILRVDAEGQAAHAARPHLGRNAILLAADDLHRLRTFKLGRSHPLLGPCTVTVTTIEGGRARNMVPDRCTFMLDIRTTPAYTHEEITEQLQNHLEACVTVHSKRLVPVDTPPEARIVAACRMALPGAEPFGSATMSDWLFLRDLPVVKIGPGESRLSHTAQEHIAPEAVTHAAAAYQSIIKAYYDHAR